MAIWLVLHQKLVKDFRFLEQNFDPWVPYVLVAEVKAETIEEAFAATNHLGGNWQDNSRVIDSWPENLKRGKGNRSTMVNDIIIQESKSMLTAWAVRNFGYKLLFKKEIKSCSSKDTQSKKRLSKKVLPLRKRTLSKPKSLASAGGKLQRPSTLTGARGLRLVKKPR